MLPQLLDLLLHVDKELLRLSAEYGSWLYAILFAIIFVETGLIVMPFLPGDSLLFAAGAIAAQGHINVFLLGILLIIAAVIGDTVNYSVGRYFKDFLARGGKLRFVKQKHLDRTHAFFERYGGKAIILARFVPIVRTMAPFCAGVGTMDYRKFFSYNVIGGVLWVVLGLAAGYIFGNFELVKKNFSVIILAIVIVSVIPIVIEAFLHWRKSRRPAEQPAAASPAALHEALADSPAEKPHSHQG
jgi:membrane-associated protein